MSDALLPRDKADALAGNVFGIVHGETAPEEKLARIVALVPMALEVVEEARETIAHLRDENEALRPIPIAAMPMIPVDDKVVALLRLPLDVARAHPIAGALADSYGEGLVVRTDTGIEGWMVVSHE